MTISFLNEFSDLPLSQVACIRNYSCNMALTVNSARAVLSFVDVCLPDLESHSIPILSRSQHAQAATVGNDFS